MLVTPRIAGAALLMMSAGARRGRLAAGHGADRQQQTGGHGSEAANPLRDKHDRLRSGRGLRGPGRLFLIVAETPRGCQPGARALR